ncbi:MAG: HAD family hydrolase [Candidatus Thorarchaeota archaeon]
MAKTLEFGTITSSIPKLTTLFSFFNLIYFMTLSFMYIIWDFDGTLFNTYPYIVSVINTILKDNYDLNLDRNQIQDWCKISLRFLFKKLESDFKVNKSEFQNLFSKQYVVNLETQQQPYPGVEEVLQLFHREGGKNFIVTHRGSKSLFRLLDYYKIETLFEKVITNEDRFPNKPDPASFLYLISENKIPRDEVLAVGDRAIDVQTANAIKIKSCYFNPEGKRDELADFNIKHLLELKGILNL